MADHDGEYQTFGLESPQEGDDEANVASFAAFQRLKEEKEKREQGSRQGDMSGRQETLF